MNTTQTATSGTQTTGQTNTRVYPAFQAHDPEALLRFLVDALGFVENVAYARRQPRQLAHAMMI